MNYNLPIEQDVWLDSRECPNRSDVWPYNWVPRIQPPYGCASGKSVYAWMNKLNQQKKPLGLVIPGPDSISINQFKP